MARCIIISAALVHTDSTHNKLYHAVIRILHTCKKLTVITGAGISASCGSMVSSLPHHCTSADGSVVPTWHNEQGTLTKEAKAAREAMTYPGCYASHQKAATKATFVQLRHLCENAYPSHFHNMLGDIAAQGRLRRVLTQNIDGVEHRLKVFQQKRALVPLEKDKTTSWPYVVQLHGDIHYLVCDKCYNVTRPSLEEYEEAIFSQCEACGERSQQRFEKHGLRKTRDPGELRPRVLNYGENPVTYDEVNIKNVQDDDKGVSDTLLVAGTKLGVDGTIEIVKRLIEEVQHRGGRAIYVSTSKLPAEFAELFDVHFLGTADEFALHSCMGFIGIEMAWH